MASVGRVLDLARSHIGQGESPPGSNCQQFSTYWHHPCEAWCADFATAMLRQAGALDVAQSSYTPTLAGNYQKAGRWYHSPRPGDLVFFQWPGVGRICHVGIVEAVHSDGSIVTVEGNTDDHVMRRVRKAYIVGYGRPVYSSVGKPAPKPRPVPKPKSHPQIQMGSRGAAVRECQAKLNAKGARPTLVADGVFGPKTDAAVRTFQSRNKLVVDGVVGVHTWAALDR